VTAVLPQVRKKRASSLGLPYAEGIGLFEPVASTLEGRGFFERISYAESIPKTTTGSWQRAYREAVAASSPTLPRFAATLGPRQPSIIQPQRGCAMVAREAATALRLRLAETLQPNVAALRGNVGLEAATASRLPLRGSRKATKRFRAIFSVRAISKNPFSHSCLGATLG